MRYRVITSYAGAIDIEVEANNEAEAENKANQILDEMDDEYFLLSLNPQVQGTEIEEVKEK